MNVEGASRSWSRRALSISAMILTCSLSARGEVHVAASQALAAAVNKPQPEYNSLARQMKVTGDVAVEVRIAPSGAVDQVKALSGNALLSSGVVRTLKKWRFKPFEQDGKPAVAVTTLRFNFKGH